MGVEGLLLKLLERLHGCFPVVAAMDGLMLKRVPRVGGTHVHKMRLMSEQVDGRSRRVLGSCLTASQWQLFLTEWPKETGKSNIAWRFSAHRAAALKLLDNQSIPG